MEKGALAESVQLCEEQLHDNVEVSKIFNFIVRFAITLFVIHTHNYYSI